MSGARSYGPCVGPECDRNAYYKTPQLCTSHYQQRKRGGSLFPVSERGFSTAPMSDDDVAMDIEDFERLLETGSTIATALVRMGMSGRTMQRRYQRAGRKTPAGLHTAARLTPAELRKRAA